MSWSHEDATNVLLSIWGTLPPETGSQIAKRAFIFLEENKKYQTIFDLSGKNANFFEFWLREIWMLPDEQIFETFRILKLKAFE
jgi:hypothetical protein